MRSVASELSIEWPPSMPIIEAMRPLLEGALHVVGGEGQLEGLGPALHHPMHDVDLLERGA